jgi:hypothetical protein
MTEQAKNGSEVTDPQANISAQESGGPSEVKTSEKKSSEGALKGAELLLAIIGIVKLVIDLLKKAVKIPKLLHKYRLLIQIYQWKHCGMPFKELLILLLIQILKKT